MKHWSKDCTESSKKQKSDIKVTIFAAKDSDGTTNNTHNQSRQNNSENPSSGTTGRVMKARKQPIVLDSASCPMTVSDKDVSVDLKGRCDDGSDASIFSPILA